MVNDLVYPLIAKVGIPVTGKQDDRASPDRPGLAERLVRSFFGSCQTIICVLFEALEELLLVSHSVRLPSYSHVQLGLGERDCHQPKEVGDVTRKPAQGHRLLIWLER